MATKTERLYTSLLPWKVVSFDDIMESAQDILGADVDRKYVYRKYVARLVDTGKLQRIRRGIYAVLSPIEEIEGYVADRFLIASKIRDRYFLGFHTALEFYGCAYSVYNEAYVCVIEGDRFEPFEFQGVRFRPVMVKDVDTDVEEKMYGKSTLRVSGKERTFIDCIARTEHAGGWEECLKSLAGLGGLDFKKMLQLLQIYDNEKLYRKSGYILEIFKKNSLFYKHIEENILDEIEDHITEGPRYLVQGKNGSLNKRWNLYIPPNFEDNLRGI